MAILKPDSTKGSGKIISFLRETPEDESTKLSMADVDGSATNPYAQYLTIASDGTLAWSTVPAGTSYTTVPTLSSWGSIGETYTFTDSVPYTTGGTIHKMPFASTHPISSVGTLTPTTIAGIGGASSPSYGYHFGCDPLSPPATPGTWGVSSRVEKFSFVSDTDSSTIPAPGFASDSARTTTTGSAFSSTTDAHISAAGEHYKLSFASDTVSAGTNFFGTTWWLQNNAPSTPTISPTTPDASAAPIISTYLQPQRTSPLYTPFYAPLSTPPAQGYLGHYGTATSNGDYGYYFTGASIGLRATQFGVDSEPTRDRFNAYSAGGNGSYFNFNNWFTNTSETKYSFASETAHQVKGAAQFMDGGKTATACETFRLYKGGSRIGYTYSASPAPFPEDVNVSSSSDGSQYGYYFASDGFFTIPAPQPYPSYPEYTYRSFSAASSDGSYAYYSGGRDKVYAPGAPPPSYETDFANTDKVEKFPFSSWISIDDIGELTTATDFNVGFSY